MKIYVGDFNALFSQQTRFILANSALESLAEEYSVTCVLQCEHVHCCMPHAACVNNIVSVHGYVRFFRSFQMATWDARLGQN